MRIWAQSALVILFAAAAGGGYQAYQNYFPNEEQTSSVGRGTRAPVPVIVSPVSVEHLEQRAEAVGTTRAVQSVDVVSTASGRIVSLNFESGQRVGKGDILLTLDDEIERANLEESKANLREMVAALERARSLRRNNTVSQAQVDQLAAKYTVAQADHSRAVKRLADRTVRAPFAGVTGLRRVDIGARIDNDTVVTTLDDLSSVELEFLLPEVLYGKLRRGIAITAVSAAFPGREFTARIANVDSRIDETARAFRVRAVMPNPDLLLPVGMFMTVSVVLDSRDAMMIPEAAVIFEGRQTHVFVIAEGKALRRNVTLGQRRRGLVEVAAGLEPGELVVERGTQSLRAGTVVSVVESSAPATDDPATREKGKEAGDSS